MGPSLHFAAGALFGAAALLMAQRLRARAKQSAIPAILDDEPEPEWLAEAASWLSSSAPASPDKAGADEEVSKRIAQQLLDASKGGDAAEVERLVQLACARCRPS